MPTEMASEPHRLTRFEVCRLLSMRALQLAEGGEARVRVADEALRTDFLYVAALELWENALDAKVRRASGVEVDARAVARGTELLDYLNARDGGRRVFRSQ